MVATSCRTNCFLSLVVLFLATALISCSTVNAVPPEVNLMGIDVQDITLSHVNLLADLRVFNPNDRTLNIRGVDYTLNLEGIKVFTGKNNLRQSISPHEYGNVTLRLSSAYWDIIKLFDTLPNKSDITYSMQGSIRVGDSGLFAKHFSFDKDGTISLQKISP